jgi:hypothetical protein
MAATVTLADIRRVRAIPQSAPQPCPARDSGPRDGSERRRLDRRRSESAYGECCA